MAWSRIQAVTGADQNNTATPSATWSGPTTAGNCLVAFALVATTGSPYTSATCSDGRETWTQIGTVISNTSISCIAMFYAPNCVGGTANTVTVTFTGGSLTGAAAGVSLLEYSGLATSSLDGYNSQVSTVSGTSLTTGSIPVSAANELMVAGGFSYQNPGMTWTAGPNLTTSTSNDATTIYIEDGTVSTAQSATYTTSVSHGWGMIGASFKLPSGSASKNIYIGTTSYSNIVKTFSPSAYWQLNEISGSTAISDSSGNNYNSTLVSSVGFGSPGPGTNGIGTAAEATGASYIEFNAGASIYSFPITYSAWIKFSPGSPSAAFPILEYQYSGTSNVEWGIDLSGKQFYTSSGSLQESATGNIYSDNGWHFLSTTVDSLGNINFYYDGGTAGTGSASVPTSGGTLGLIMGDGAHSLSGLSLAQVTVFPSALSLQDINTLYRIPTTDGSILSLGSFGSVQTSTIQPTSILSSEIFGSPQVNTVLTVSVSPSETFGLVQINLSLYASSLLSSESFGLAQLIPILPPSILSSETFGSATLIEGGPQSVYLSTGSGTSLVDDSILSSEGFGSPLVQSIVWPNSLISSETFEFPQINTIYAEDLYSSEIFGLPQSNTIIISGYAPLSLPLVLPQTLNYQENSISSGESFGPLEILGIIYPNSIITSEIFEIPQINTLTISSSINSSETFGSPQINEIQLNSINSSENIPSLFMVVLDQAGVSPWSLDSSENWDGNSIISTILVDSISSSEIFGVLQTNVIQVVSISSSESFDIPQVISTIYPNSINSSETFENLQISALLPAGISSSENFGLPNIELGIIINSILSSENFGLPSINTITINSILSSESFGLSEVIPPSFTVGMRSIDSSESWDGNSQINTIVSNSIPSQETFSSPLIAITISNRVLYMNSLSSSEIFGLCFLNNEGRFPHIYDVVVIETPVPIVDYVPPLL